MFKMGDILFVNGYIGDDGVSVGYHPFLVVSDRKGVVEGFCFDTIGTVLSSFDGKPEEYKQKKLRHEENMGIEASQTAIVSGQALDGYTKADQLYFFEKDELNYRYFGKADEKVLDNLLKKITYLESVGKLRNNTYNLKNRSELEIKDEETEEAK